jgi:23S rRNA pseudouridine1911/1915/1917 synthase
MIPRTAISILEKQVAQRLRGFSDQQIMSVGSSFASLQSLSDSTFRDLRNEVCTRGRTLDDRCLRQEFSFRNTIPHFETVYEDGDIAIINKPPGIVVSLNEDLNDIQKKRWNKPSGNSQELQQLIESASPLPISQDARFAYGILHRLDRDTSGALLIAKNFESFYDLRLQFACGLVMKEYTALSHGWLEPLGKTADVDSRITTVKELTKDNHLNIKSQIARDGEGKHALTQVTPVAHYLSPGNGEQLSLVKARIHTGRSHQIRVHMASIGHPLVNDGKYGTRENEARILLHASKLGFMQKRGDDFVYREVPLFHDFQEKLSELEIVKDVNS